MSYPTSPRTVKETIIDYIPTTSLLFFIGTVTWKTSCQITIPRPLVSVLFDTAISTYSCNFQFFLCNFSMANLLRHDCANAKC